MKVLLKKDHESLGAAGDVKEVKDGFARNFLIPQGIVTPATTSNLKSYEEVKRQKSRKTERETKDAKVIASRLEASPLTIVVKTAEEGKIYGSVTPQMIYDLLVAKGYQVIDRKKITIPDHIKSVGEYEVDVKLYTNVVAKLKVIVEGEKTEETAETIAEASSEATETTEETKSE
jgi:large subunit ribosomal protein L9